MPEDDHGLRRPRGGVRVRTITATLVAGVIGATALAFPAGADGTSGDPTTDAGHGAAHHVVERIGAGTP